MAQIEDEKLKEEKVIVTAPGVLNSRESRVDPAARSPLVLPDGSVIPSTAVLPSQDEIRNHDYRSGPTTFNGEKLAGRGVPQGGLLSTLPLVSESALSAYSTALPSERAKMEAPKAMGADGSWSIYVDSMAYKRLFEYMHGSPARAVVSAWLALWTTRTWTYTIKSAEKYLKGFMGWLRLDYVGRAFGTGSTMPWGASGNKAADKRDKIAQPGAVEPGPE